MQWPNAAFAWATNFSLIPASEPMSEVREEVRTGASRSVEEEQVKQLNRNARKLSKGNPELAESQARSAQKLARRLGMTYELAYAHNVIGIIRLAQSDAAGAHEEADAALKISRITQDTRNIWTALKIRGRAATMTGDYHMALEALLENLSIQERTGNKQELSKVLMDLSRIYTLLEAFSSALDYCLKSLTIRRQLGNRTDISLALNNLGLICSEIGDHGQALEYFLESTELQTVSPGDSLICGTENNISRAYQALGELDAALLFAQRSLKKSRESGNQYVESLALRSFGEICMERGLQDDALRYFEQSLDLCRLIGDKHGAAQTLHSMAVLSLELQRIDEAEARLAELGELVKDLGLKKLAFELEYTCSQIHAQRGEYKEAWRRLNNHHKLKEAYYDSREQKRLRDILVLRQVESWSKRVENYRRHVDELATLNERLQELNEEKSEFLGIAAHDLKNPLSGIMMTAEVLIHQFERLDECGIKQRADVIYNAAMRMSDIIGSLLDINAIESGSMQVNIFTFPLEPVLRDLVHSWEERAQHKGIAITTSIEPATIDVRADRDMLHRVLDNLLSNAIKFSQPGTQVQIRAVLPEGGGVCITVADQGPGLTDGDHERMFTKFGRLSAKPTANEHSTGLGLSIVKKLLDLVGGAVRCKSTPGRGSSFIVELPGGSACTGRISGGHKAG